MRSFFYANSTTQNPKIRLSPVEYFSWFRVRAFAARVYVMDKSNVPFSRSMITNVFAVFTLVREQTVVALLAVIGVTIR